MGISSILKAKKIILLAWGNKAGIVAKSVEGNVTESIPASIYSNTTTVPCD
jgi:glucosamine-6-phosphate deaminase